jgi:DNA-binding MarR family transcriptional regulator
MPEVPTLTPEEWALWRSFRTMRRQLDLALEHELQRDAHVSGPDYEILITLFEAPEKQLRARELTARLGWEKSRLSHQVTRMVARGLVERSECDADARGTWIGLTTAGRRATLGAVRAHAQTIRRLFFDVLSEHELVVLQDVSARVIEAIDPPDCDTLDGEESAVAGAAENARGAA